MLHTFKFFSLIFKSCKLKKGIGWLIGLTNRKVALKKSHWASALSFKRVPRSWAYSPEQSYGSCWNFGAEIGLAGGFLWPIILHSSLRNPLLGECAGLWVLGWFNFEGDHYSNSVSSFSAIFFFFTKIPSHLIIYRC